MSGLGRRLRKLEEAAGPERGFPDWPIEDQLEGVADTLDFYARFHADGRARYPATDREIDLLGILCALREDPLGEEGGEHRFPSGLVVALIRESDAFSWEAPRPVRLEDLPEDVRRLFVRMAPERQPEREAFLYEDRHRSKKDRERIRWHEEHGWDEPTPERLRTWEVPGEGGAA